MQLLGLRETSGLKVIRATKQSQKTYLPYLQLTENIQIFFYLIALENVEGKKKDINDSHKCLMK